MPDPNPMLDLSALDNLSDTQRLAVHHALKGTLERELTRVSTNADAGQQGGGTQHTRESGPLHGSQHDKTSASLADHALLNRIHQMDENQFAQFAQRLATIKQGGGG
jgi:hypothetical protein